MGSNRAVSIYVPTSYSSTTKYRLIIGLHGLGDTCSNYRNGLVVTFAANIPNTIFVCPEAANKSGDFYDGSGGEQIIQKSIDMASSVYHIDTANIILQGFSLGGRAALRYGLDNYSTLKGLLLNTPAIQGVKEALNGHPTAYSFNYANVSQIPIFITHGSTDIAYASSIDSMNEQLILNDGKLRFIEVAGMGHAIPSYAIMSDFLNFFNTPAHAGLDLEVSRFYPNPLVSCSATSGSRLLFRNNGQTTITSAKFNYSVGSSTQSVTWTGSLAPFQHAWLSTNISGLANGGNAVSVAVDTLNGILPDSVSNNNQTAATLHYNANALSGLDEGFEGPDVPANWVLQEAGDFYSAWAGDNTVFKSGAQSIGTFNTIFFFDNAGRGEGLISPLVKLDAVKPRLSFDVAYNYHEYTPPYFSATVDFADTLEVLISTDCGDHYTQIYKKGGKDLATFSTPIINPLSIDADFITPADSNWRNEKIDLSSFVASGSVNALFKFNYVSALGGSINMDNVKVGSATSVLVVTKPNFHLYPNPAKDQLHVTNPTSDANVLFQLYDMSGRLLNSSALSHTNGDNTINISELSSGIFLYKIVGAAGLMQQGKWMKG